jgi:hypothetical protein
MGYKTGGLDPLMNRGLGVLYIYKIGHFRNCLNSNRWNIFKTKQKFKDKVFLQTGLEEFPST